MIVGVNLLWCLPGAVGGSEEYLARQLVGLHRAAPDITTRLVVLPGYVAAHPEVVERAEQIELAVAPLDARRRSRRVLTETTWLPAHLRGVDVVHHGGGSVPPRSPRPIVLTVHDVQYRTYPRYFSRLKRHYLAAVVPRSIRRAAIVTVPSAYVRTTLVDAFGTDPDTVVVVAHGIEAPAPTEPDAIADARRRFHLGDGPFAVFPAITHPHKNHRFLVDLLAGPWRERDLRLVLLGGAGTAEPAVAAAIAGSGVADRIVRPGRVSDVDRDALVAGADVLLFPSEYEGFGAPVLEAMAAGTPVVAADRAALPEVVADAGLVRPLTAEAWADALDEVDTRRDELVAAGRRRAAWFNVTASGQQLAAAYRRAAAGRR